MASLRFISFFAGIGGGDRGFEQAGYQCVAQIEAAAEPRTVLAAHWPAVPLFGDVRGLLWPLLPVAELYIISDPCQRNTMANSRIADGKTPQSLWRYALGGVAVRRPTYVVRENPTHQRKDAPSSHEIVAADLENLGYECTIIDMQGGEVSSVSRQRTFVCAGLGQAGRRLGELLDRRRCSKGDWPSHGSQAQPFAALTCHPFRYDNRDNFIAYPDGRCRVLSHAERLRAQGFPEEWLDALGPVGLHTVAKLTGNAWPPFMARFIGRLLNESTEDIA
jgi:site-specific DNA-cytosine methylase